MRGILRESSRQLASYRDGKRLSEAYRLLITKKPVEYDYVAIDATSFVPAAMRLTKNTTDARRIKEVARHVFLSIQQLLRRIVCKQSLLIAFDGAGTAAQVHYFRHTKVTRRLQSRITRLPGTSLLRGVEERIVKAMPLNRTLVPREVVVSGVNVEGAVERKVAAWALDLACRDGTKQHTSRSLCVVGSTGNWQTILGLTPFFQSTHVLHSSTTDLRHLTLTDTLTWLALDLHVRAGDTHAVTTGRTDALLLTLLCYGSGATELAALPGANFTVLMDAYHRRRAKEITVLSSAAAGTASHPSAAAASPSFQLFYDLPNACLELDLLALYVVFLRDDDVAAEVAELTSHTAQPFARATTGPIPWSELPTQPLPYKNGPSHAFCESYLRHLLSTQHLLCYGASVPYLQTVPVYLSHLTRKHEVAAPTSVASVRISARNQEEVGATGAPGVRAGGVGSALLSAAEFVRYLRTCIVQGRRYRRSDQPVSTAPLSVAGGVTQAALTVSPLEQRQQQQIPLEESPARLCTELEAFFKQRVPSSASLAEGAATAAAVAAAPPNTRSSSDPAPASTPPTDRDVSYPFWRQDQPMTNAEYTALCQDAYIGLEPLLREYMGPLGSHVRPDFIKKVLAPQVTVEAARHMLLRLFAHASPESAHPSLCFGPSYCWTQHEKTKLWSMRYVDLGTQARETDIRHTRGLLVSGINMTQQQSEEGAVGFDEVAQAWLPMNVIAAAVTAPPSQTLGSAGKQPEGDGEGDSQASSLGEADGAVRTGSSTAAGRPRTLKVLTWNVMFDRYSGQPTPLGMPGIDWCSPQRYPVLAKLIAQEDADVVGMQEVEAAFADYLAAQPWCRARYIMSCGPRSSVLDPWGVLMLIRRGPAAWPLQQLTHLNIPAWSSHVSLMPVATLDLRLTALGAPCADASGTSACVPQQVGARQSRLVNVCSMHLLAPFVKANETARTGQDQALRHALTRQVHGDTLVMGDFNDWPSNEFEMPPETRYHECWPLLHPDKYGKTMDESNTFCKLKIEEIFFGRSDKVFLRASATGRHGGARALLTPLEAHLVGTRSVNVENGNHDAPAYLFPSDHYGVSMTFQVN